jgi:hypothetical protein
MGALALVRRGVDPGGVEMEYWFNLRTGQVETDATRSRDPEVLGPYASVEEARAALETARARTERWDEEDREWEAKGAAGSWDDKDLED